MLLKCMCCDFEEEWSDGEEAYVAGWDAPPYFSTHVTCPFCPIDFLFGGSHDDAHQKWLREGRPARDAS